MRIAFLGSPPFAVPIFKRLLESPHTVVMLVTQPDRPRGRGMKIEASALVELAQARGVPVLQPQSTKTPEFVAALRACAPDVLLVASYGEILRQEVLDLAPRGALNVHGSLLPRWRGAAPIQAAILAGDEESGVSIQRMVKKLDAGDVLLEVRTPIGPEETSAELFERLAQLGADAALQALTQVEAGTARYIPQDEARVTHAHKLEKAHGRIDWSRSASELARQVRALNPWPMARCGDGKGGELVVLRARPVETATSLEPGCASFDAGQVRVACGRGQLELLEVKPAGKGSMPAPDWWRGARLPVGTKLTLP